MRTVTEDERDLRAALVDVEILIDAKERYPLRYDLGWRRFEVAVLKGRAARLRQQIALVRALTERADTEPSTDDSGRIVPPVDGPPGG